MVIVPSLKVYNRFFHVPKRRAFFPSSGKICRCKGSMALEGGLVLPIFLLFMLTVLLSLETVRLQSNMAEGLYVTGNEYAIWASGKESGNSGWANAEAGIKEYLDGQFLPYLCVKGGRDGVGVQDNSSRLSGKVEIKTEYSLSSAIWWLPVGEIVIKDSFLGHSWCGYTGKEDGILEQEKEVYVYVTKTGSKYHLSHDCSYLQVQIKRVEAAWLETGRNKWGAKYYPCNRCRPQEKGMIYITEDGRNYHSYGDCSALKRTIYIIPLSEAEGYLACSRCGK